MTLDFTPSKLLYSATIATVSQSDAVAIGALEKFIILVDDVAYWNWGTSAVIAADTDTLIPGASGTIVHNKGAFSYIRIYNPNGTDLRVSVVAIYSY